MMAAEDSSLSNIADANTIEVGWSIYIPSSAEAESFLAGEIAAPGTYSEAPMWAEMVAAGELPPVEERLPAEPLVVQPVESVGQYGGTWNRAFTGIKGFHAWGRINYEPMLRWPRDPKDPVQPGLAKEWKWSDGAPFTVDDIIFWWEAIETNTDITAAPHAEWMVNGKPMELEKVDDLTIKLRFDGPNGLAETTGLAFHGNQWPLGFDRFVFFAPKHYLEQYIPITTPR